MTSSELRKKYLEFFKEKGHAIVPSAPLIPENDPSTLFTGSGMQPMIPYLLGEKHPLGIRIVDSQKCFRSQDIEDVGNNRHTTLFEMLGNWSLGDYFKKEQITWIFEFLTKEIGLDPKRIYITVFRGNELLNIPRDIESVETWKKEFEKFGVDSKDIDFAEKNGMQGGRIFYYDESKNWWSRSGVPAGMPLGEPGGPDSEMFWDFGAELEIHENSKYKNAQCHVNCDCGRFLEIGNNVFMEYIKTEKGFEKLPQKNVDFGGGLERMLAAKNDTADIFLTDLFTLIISGIEKICGRKYEEYETKRAIQIITDHIKAATFMLAERLEPSNVERGYVLRRLIRRAVRYGKQLGINDIFTFKIAQSVIDIYSNVYPELKENKDFIEEQLVREEEKFNQTLERGLKEFEKLEKISGKDAFNLYQTYGFPFEMTVELAKEKGIVVDEKEFNEKLNRHQELSRTATTGTFKSGLADHSEQVIKYHTAAHLMLAALRKVLGEHVSQKGSNITSERLRFDFSHPTKMTSEQIKQVEDLVNQKIQEDLPVKMEEITLDEAKKQGAMGVFESKYGEKVKVYTIRVDSSQAGSELPFSREICAGPHVERTGLLGKFKIIKEESSSAGVRRIKAVLE